MIKLAEDLQKTLDTRRTVTFEHCNATRLPFDDEMFDAVISDNMIDVCNDQKMVLCEAHRVLKQGGTLALSFESFKDALGEEDKEEWFQFENYSGIPKFVYTVRTRYPSYLEREYILFLDPSSEVGRQVRSASPKSLKEIPTDINDILKATSSCRFWESVHHDNNTMRSLLVDCGFVDITDCGEGTIICQERHEASQD